MLCEELFLNSPVVGPPVEFASPEYPESPEYPDVYRVMQELYPSIGVAVESMTTTRDTFDLLMSEPRPMREFKYESNVFSFKFSSWVLSTAQVMRMVGGDIHAMHHTTALFLKYLHRDPKPISIEAHWNAFHWHRVACFWIALKYSDVDFEDITLLVTNAREKTALIAAEIEVMRVVNYELAPPPDYMYLLGVLLSVPDTVMDRARDLLMLASSHPSKFYDTPYVVTCSACIVAARENLDGRSEIYVDQLRRLDIPTPFLLLLAERVLSL